MSFETRLEAFEGPLDLLLHLIEKNKVDIYDIPISEITDQYLEYLSDADSVDADIMSSFLVMAATLLDIKAKLLLPAEKEDDEEADPREELVRQLLEYKMYKYMSYELKDKELTSSKTLYRKPSVPKEVAEYVPDVDLNSFMGDITIIRLKMVFDDCMSRAGERTNPDALRYEKVQREEIKVEDKMEELRAAVKEKNRLSFRELLDKQYDRIHIIVMFLAVLELMKTGEIRVAQKSFGSDIILYTGDAYVQE